MPHTRHPSDATADAATAAAQLAWIVLPGPEIDDDSATLLARGAGGVVLFGRNITGAAQLAGLTSELRRIAPGALRIAIDHEGGHVVRMGSPLTRFPSSMAISATGSEELAHAVARAAGSELAAMGVDVNLAPVLDVCLDLRNPSVGARSFGSSPATVGRFGSAMIRGYRDAGIAATAKHFPGHGRTPVDPHVGLPEVMGGLEALRENDLPPFHAAMDAGVDLVMVSHVAYEGLTDGSPSTLTARVAHDLLRTELGFDGLVLSDAMNMRALADGNAIPEACVRAIAAGVDIVMPLEDQEETLAALERAIASNRLPAARIADILDRLERLDARLAGDRAPTPVVGPGGEHVELARTVARESLTLLHDEGVLPLNPSVSVAVVEFPSRRPSLVEEEIATPSLAAALRRHLARVAEVIVGGPELTTDERATIEARAIEAAGAAEVVVLATRDAYMFPEDQQLIGTIAAAGRPTIMVALRNPYDLALATHLRTNAAVAAYADVPATLEALADAFTGRAGWPGRLPVELPAWRPPSGTVPA